MAQAFPKPLADPPAPGMIRLVFQALGRVLGTLGRTGIIAAK